MQFGNSLRSRDWLAGAEGIEPSNAGIKIQCLTTWRRPSRSGGKASGAVPYKASRPSPQTIQNAAGPRLCARLYGRLRGQGGIVIRAPPEARGVPFALVRRVAQPGRALRSGRRGRRFESSLSDQISFNKINRLITNRAKRLVVICLSGNHRGTILPPKATILPPFRR